MRAVVQVDHVASQGFLGSKMKFRVFVQLHLEDDESALIDAYRPYSPSPFEYLEMRDDDKIDFEKIVRKAGGSSLIDYTKGVTVECDTIQLAGKYEDALLEAFKTYRGQIDLARLRNDRLGEAREIEV